MSSFMSRFGLNKKTSESPAVPKNASNNNTSVNNSMVGGNALSGSGMSFVNNNAGSRNYASAGPIKANT
jgi:hypothetical protein